MNNSNTKEPVVLPPLELVQIIQINEQAIPIDGQINPEWLLSPLVSAEVVSGYLNVKIVAFLPEELERDSFELFDVSDGENPCLKFLLKYEKEMPSPKSYFTWYICYECPFTKGEKEVMVSVKNCSLDNGNPRTSRGTVTQIMQSY